MKSYLPGLGFLVALATSSYAQTTELRLAHYLPPAHPLSQSVAEWAKRIEASSGGTSQGDDFSVGAARQSL